VDERRGLQVGQQCVILNKSPHRLILQISVLEWQMLVAI